MARRQSVLKDLKPLGFPNEPTHLTDLKLPSQNQFRGKATDGKDPGADVERIQSFLADQ
jgi:hypothetical protein